MDAPIVQKDLTDSHMDTRTFPPGHPLYFPPTQPTTPIIEALSSSGRSSVITHSPLSPFASPLPIIAPPPYLLIPRAPHTVEGIAEEHIAMMLVKEQIERLNDNLPLLRDFRGAGKNSESKPQREVVDEDDCESTEEGEFDDEDSEMDYSSMNEHDSEREGNSQVSDDEGFSKNPVDVTVCIQEDFRREVVEWVLGVSEVLLPESFSPHLSSFSFTLALPNN